MGQDGNEDNLSDKIRPSPVIPVLAEENLTKTHLKHFREE